MRALRRNTGAPFRYVLTTQLRGATFAEWQAIGAQLGSPECQLFSSVRKQPPLGKPETLSAASPAQPSPVGHAATQAADAEVGGTPRLKAEIKQSGDCGRSPERNRSLFAHDRKGSAGGMIDRRACDATWRRPRSGWIGRRRSCAARRRRAESQASSDRSCSL